MHTTTSMMRRTLTSTMRVVGTEQLHLTRLAPPQRRVLRVPCSIACLKLSRVQCVASLVWQVLPLSRATTMLTSTAMVKITGMHTSTSMHTTTSTSFLDFLLLCSVSIHIVDNLHCKSNYMINCPPA